MRAVTGVDVDVFFMKRGGKRHSGGEKELQRAGETIASFIISWL